MHITGPNRDDDDIGSRPGNPSGEGVVNARFRPQRPAAPPPAPRPFPAPARVTRAPERPPEDDAARELLRSAEELNIPWQRLLRDEIAVEQILRRHAGGVEAEMPLATALSLLPSSFLKSWRVRDHIQNLSCEARGASFKGAITQLRAVFRRLIGKSESGRGLYSGHLWLAYQRVLLLQRVCLAARRSAGTNAERIAFICSRTRCTFDDAAWALCLEDSPRPGHRLDEAVRKVRQEGFQIPREATEAKSFARLRRVARAAPESPGPRLRRRKRRGDALPQRVELPSDAV
ncbi:MAG TPA: hypothetical protein VGH97_08615 [Thermoanaerobaculia bacterium]|jgi:hypothetical protein